MTDQKELNYELINAALYGDLEKVKKCIKADADIHGWDGDDWPLRFAAKYGYLNIVKYLVEHGANIHAKKDGAVRWAALNGHTDVVEYLEKQMNKRKLMTDQVDLKTAKWKKAEDEFYKAIAEMDDFIKLDFLCEHHPMVFYENKESYLLHAITCGKLEVVKYLWKNKHVGNGFSFVDTLNCLERAITFGHKEITDYLLTIITFVNDDVFKDISVAHMCQSLSSHIKELQSRIKNQDQDEESEFEDIATDSPENTEQIKTSLSEINSSGDFDKLKYLDISLCRTLEISVLNGFSTVTRYLIDKVTDISCFKELLIDSCEYIDYLLEDRNE